MCVCERERESQTGGGGGVAGGEEGEIFNYSLWIPQEVL